MKRFILILCATFIGLSLSAQSDINVSVAKYKGGKVCATSFTFDDGNKDNYTIGAHELDKRGWKGTFWLVCSRIPGEARASQKAMSWEDVTDLHKRGHEMSNHGWSHKNLVEISYDEAAIEIEKNDSALFAHLGVRPVTFCYPYNKRNPKIEALALKGRVGTRTFQYPFDGRYPVSKFHERMDKTIADGGWAVWMTHGVAQGKFGFKELTDFTSFLDYVKQNEDKIWVGTFKDVATYVAERDAVTLKINNKKGKVNVTPSLPLDSKLFNAPLTMCVEGIVPIKVTQGKTVIEVTRVDKKAYFDFNPRGGKIVITY